MLFVFIEIFVKISYQRNYARVPFNLELYFPQINGKSTADGNKDIPIIKGIEISVGGIGFRSRIHMEIGDYIEFLMQIENNPSFTCMAVVKWTGYDDETLLVGTEFFCLSMEQINQIKNYVNSKETLSKRFKK